MRIRMPQSQASPCEGESRREQHSGGSVRMEKIWHDRRPRSNATSVPEGGAEARPPPIRTTPQCTFAWARFRTGDPTVYTTSTPTLFDRERTTFANLSERRHTVARPSACTQTQAMSATKASTNNITARAKANESARATYQREHAPATAMGLSSTDLAAVALPQKKHLGETELCSPCLLLLADFFVDAVVGPFRLVFVG